MQWLTAALNFLGCELSCMPMKRGFKAAAVKENYQRRDVNFVSSLRTKEHGLLLNREQNTCASNSQIEYSVKSEVAMVIESAPPTQVPSWPQRSLAQPPLLNATRMAEAYQARF